MRRCSQACKEYRVKSHPLWLLTEFHNTHERTQRAFTGPAVQRRVVSFVVSEGGGRFWFALIIEICAISLSEPLLHYSLFWGQLANPIVATYGQISLSRSQFSHFLSHFRPRIFPTYQNFLIPKISKRCDPILVILFKIQSH